MTSLFWITPQGVFEGLTFDVTLSETHTSAADVTDHPVEVGSNITDNVRPQRKRLSLKVGMSNTPIYMDATDGLLEADETLVFQSLRIAGRQVAQKKAATVSGGLINVPNIVNDLPTRVNGFTKRLGTDVKATAAEWADKDVALVTKSPQSLGRVDRCTAMFETLTFLCSSGQAVIVETDLHTYDAMLIESVSSDVGADDSQMYTVTLSEQRLVETASVEVSRKAAVKTKDSRAQAVVDAGKKAETVPALTPEQRASMLTKVVGYLGDKAAQ